MNYKSFLGDTILISSQAVDFYLWLLTFLLILSTLSFAWLVIVLIKLLISYANVAAQRIEKLRSKKSVKRALSFN